MMFDNFTKSGSTGVVLAHQVFVSDSYFNSTMASLCCCCWLKVEGEKNDDDDDADSAVVV